jgi:hypothetical protein
VFVGWLLVLELLLLVWFDPYSVGVMRGHLVGRGCADDVDVSIAFGFKGTWCGTSIVVYGLGDVMMETVSRAV